MRLALDATEMGVFQWDLVTDRTDADSRLLQMIGLDARDEFSFKAAVSRYIGVRDRERYAAAVTAMLDPSGPGRMAEEVCWTGSDGRERWLAFSGQSFFEGTGVSRRAVRIVGGVFDITTRKRVEEALRTSEVRFRALVQDASDIVVVLGAEGQFQYSSQALERILGYPEASFADAPYLDMVHPDDLDTVRHAWQSVIQTPASRVQVTYRTRNVKGDWVWLDGIMTNLLEVPEVAGIVINVRDVTEQKRLEAQLRHLALHDPLTGLPNRTLLADRMDQALRLAAVSGHRVGLLFLDVDYFKQVNDAFGHPVGDTFLQEIADRLRSLVQVSDTVARIGGDEFVLLVPGIGNELHATELAERVQAAMTAPFVWNGHEVVVGVTIGIAVSEPGLKHPEILLRDGDAALYRAKQAGRGRSIVHVPEMTGIAERRWRLKMDVGEAADRDELVMHYQPIVMLASGDVTGMEALLRWQHPVYGLISPDEFIPLAEEAGQIVALGRWGLARVCEMLSYWGARAPEIGLNLSATQFNDPTLVSAIVAQIARTGIDPRKLRLEITEHIVIDDIVATVSTLNQLRNLGVGVSIDDFGSGYSSLRYLRELPVTGVKLDRSFMRGLETDPGAQAMVTGIVSLTHAIGLSVTAEGIETARQLALVRAIGCDQGQGYLLAPPAPVSPEDPPLRIDVLGDSPRTSGMTAPTG
ncbi:MAG: putative bifunctional diguanylate cyclase/phosphodiesterase [Thermomicrobiales bacterium]